MQQEDGADNPGSGGADAGLIERSLSDPEAFAGVVDRHGPAIDRYVRYRLGPDAADDIVAETFLVAFRRRGSYDLDRLDARPWLFGIASNLIREHERAEHRRYRSAAAVTAGRDGASVAEQVEDRVVAEAARPELAAALAAMPVKHREVLLLVAVADLSYEEVADALGAPVGTVRSRLNRARRNIRAALGHADPRASEELRHG